MEESASTLSYVEKAQGITNKPVATSFLKVGTGAAPAARGEGEAAGSMRDRNSFKKPFPHYSLSAVRRRGRCRTGTRCSPT